MISTFREAFSIWRNNFWLLSAAILTVWLPGNILLETIYQHAESSEAFLNLHCAIRAILTPVMLGATIFAVNKIKNNESVTYTKAMSAGFKKWGAMFIARLRASITIGVGMLFLVIPGLVFMLRFSFIETAVAVEDKNAGDSIDRSVHLSRGILWRVCKVYALWGVAGAVIISISYWIPPNSSTCLPGGVALRCMWEIISFIFNIVLYLFFHEAALAEKNQSEFTEKGPAFAARIFDAFDFKQPNAGS